MERKVKTSEGYLRVRQQFVSLHIGSALSPQTENIHFSLPFIQKQEKQLGVQLHFVVILSPSPPPQTRSVP
jgi:hypothetical protein